VQLTLGYWDSWPQVALPVQKLPEARLPAQSAERRLHAGALPPQAALPLRAAELQAEAAL
jgi:hypothetical protein